MKSVPYILYCYNSGWHSSGTLKRGRQIVARYYKCDKISDAAKAKILAEYPHATFGHSRAEYAPEITSKVVIVPTIAELKRRKNKLAA